MKVLTAEDDPLSRTLLRKTLDRWGHDVFAAPDKTQHQPIPREQQPSDQKLPHSLVLVQFE